MRTFTLMTLLVLTACAPEAGGNGVDTDATADPNVALSGQAGFTTAADCYARLEAVSRLYSALASTRRGAERAELRQLSFDREAHSVQYGRLAGRIGSELGRSAGEIEAALREAQEAVERQRAARSLEAFAAWAGAEADRCPPRIDG